MQTVRGSCRVRTSVCGILVDVDVDVDGDEVVRVRGDKDHPLSKGYTCRVPQPAVDLQPRLFEAVGWWCAPRVARYRSCWDRTAADALIVYNKAADDSGRGVNRRPDHLSAQ